MRVVKSERIGVQEVSEAYTALEVVILRNRELRGDQLRKL